MKKLIGLLLIFSVFVMITAAGCGGGPPPTPFFGFLIYTTLQVNGGAVVAVGGVAVAAEWIEDAPALGTPDGTRLAFTGVTSGSGYATVDEGRTPAVWFFQEGSGRCAGQTTNVTVRHSDTVELRCSILVRSFSISPSTVDAITPPTVFELSGSDCDATYGMPQVTFYNPYGSPVWSSTASAMSYGGTWLQVPASGVEYLSSGSYTVLVSNVCWDGTTQPVGAASVYVYGNDPPPPPPPDPCQWNGCVVFL